VPRKAARLPARLNEPEALRDLENAEREDARKEVAYW
jgi:hypothetical protein